MIFDACARQSFDKNRNVYCCNHLWTYRGIYMKYGYSTEIGKRINIIQKELMI